MVAHSLLFGALAWLSTVSASDDIWPASGPAIFRPAFTQVPLEVGDAVLGISPVPTGLAMHHPRAMFKRQTNTASANSVCAYVSGSINSPLTCGGAYPYCGVKADLSVLGCCSNALTTTGSVSVDGCVFKTACYDYTATNQCTGACTSVSSVAARIAFCNDQRFPYCVKYTVTDANPPLSYFQCNTSPSATRIAVNTPSITDAAPSSSSAQITPSGTTTQREGGAAAGASPSAGAAGGNTGTPQKSSAVGPAVGGAIGGLAVILLAVGGGFWLWMKHKRNQQKAAEKGQDIATPGNGPTGSNNAYVANNHSNREYFNKAGDAGVGPSNGHADPAPPSYPYSSGHTSPNQYPFPGSYSNSPMGTPTHVPQAPVGYQPEELEGTSVAHNPSSIHRATTASPSAIGSERNAMSDGTASELEGPPASMAVSSPTAAQTTTAGPASPVSNMQSPTTPAPRMGHESGAGDWNKPYHELGS